MEIMIFFVIVSNFIYFISLYKLAKKQDQDLYFLDFITSNHKYEVMAYKLLVNKDFYYSHKSIYAKLVKYFLLPSHLSIAFFIIFSILSKD